MKNSRLRSALGAMMVFAFAAAVTGLTWAVPVREGFETMTAADDIPGYLTFTGNNAITTADKAQGSKALSVNSQDAYWYEGGVGEMDLFVDAVENAWIMLYVKPLPAGEDVFSITDDDAIGFGVTADNKVKVRNGGAWEVIDVAVPEETWIGFVVHAKFGATKEWDLYMSTSGSYSDGLNELTRIGDGLAFNTGYDSGGFTNLNVSSGGATLVDAIAVTAAQLDPGGASNQVATIERDADTMIGLPPYVYDEGQSRFGQKLGVDMAVGISDGAVMRYYTGDGDWEDYVWDDGAWQPPADLGLDIKGHAALALSNTDPGVAFYPFEGALPAPQETDVRAGDWSQLTWPLAGRKVTESDLGFGAADGDWIVIVRGGRARYFRWGNGRWNNFTTADASYELPRNAGFWYRRPGAATTWTPQ